MSSIEKIYPISPVQEGILYHYMQNNSLYVWQYVLYLNGEIDVDALNQSLCNLVVNHETLRSLFIVKGKQLLQVILKSVHTGIQYEDITAYNNIGEYVESARIDELNKGFCLHQEAAIRFKLFRVDTRQYQMLITFHHIALDGMSFRFLVDELFSAYMNIPTDEHKFQYDDYVALFRKNMNQAQEYWENYLLDYCCMDTSFNKIKNDLTSFCVETLSIPQQLKSNLKTVLYRNHITDASFFQAIWAIVLKTYFNTDDVAFGLIVSGRTAPVPHLDRAIGSFATVLPMRIKIRSNDTFLDFAQRIQNDTLQNQINGLIPLSKIKGTSKGEASLFSTTLNFEVVDTLEKSYINPKTDQQITISEINEYGNTAYNICLHIQKNGDDYQIYFKYNDNISINDIEVLKQIFINTMEQSIKNTKNNIHKISHLPLFSSMSNKLEVNCRENDILNLIESKAKEVPENVAIWCREDAITYAELLSKVNIAASYLRKKESVCENSIVAVCMEPSIDLVVAILAILKCGAVFLPIDISILPRIVKYILLDSGAKVLITKKIYHWDNLPCNVIFNEYWEASFDVEEFPSNKRGEYSYLIYTSGTTGNPKGTLITNQGLCNYVMWASKEYFRKKYLKFALFTSISFDLTITSIFVPLVSGGTIVAYDDADINVRLKRIFSENQVDIIKLTPSHIHLLKALNLSPTEYRNSALKCMIVGGEKLPTILCQQISEYFSYNVRIYNEYGPTETVVGCIVHEYNSQTDHDAYVPIGAPIDNTTVYIVNQDDNPCPIGVQGELLIAGAGLAVGYLNQVELTQRKFKNIMIQDHVQRVYCTGDICKWMPNGEIQYIGRSDDQIKLHGYRIELGEIEGVMRENENIEDAVIAYRETNRDSYLCAYIKLCAPISIAQIRQWLSNKLPLYMHPARYVIMDKFPLTSNGKVDKKKLPEPAKIISENKEDCNKPQNERQEILLKMWKNILGYPDIGIHDNFFELGGDSIKAIQIAGELFNNGYQIALRDLMEHHTVSMQSFYMKRIKDIQQQTMTGRVALTPIQKMFFNLSLSNPNHWNQSVRLRSCVRLDEKKLTKALQAIIDTHDALRMEFFEQEGRIRAVGEIKAQITTNWVDDMRYIDDLDELQVSLDIRRAPLLKMQICKTDKADYINIVAHHLIVDTVSWKIIIQDLTDAYMQLEKGQEIVLKKPTSSFAMWSSSLKKYAQREDMQHECEFWKDQLEQQQAKIAPDHMVQMRLQKNVKVQSFQLNEEQTKKLLTQSIVSDSWEINDILLSVIGKSIGEWQHLDKVFLKLESHGREQISNDLNVTRTVGWFTAEYPIYVCGRKLKWGWGERIQTIANDREKIHHNGIGYGIWRYLSQKSTSSLTEPEVTFNYLGEIDLLQEEAIFVHEGYMDSNDIGEENERSCAIEIECMIIQKKFQLRIWYDYYEFEEYTIRSVLKRIEDNLLEIISYCVNFHENHSSEDLKNYNFSILNEYEAEYTLSPVQIGMAFQFLINPQASFYLQRAEYIMRGEFDIYKFRQCLNCLVERHEMLRTIFKLDCNYRQCVLKCYSPDVFYQAVKANEKEAILSSFRKRQNNIRFDLERECAYNIQILSIEDEHHVFVTYHHILLDAYSIHLLIKELKALYLGYCTEKIPCLQAISYSEYLTWISKRNKDNDLQFWNQYFKQITYEKRVLNDTNGELKVSQLCFRPETIKELYDCARQLKMSVNTVLLSAWGLTLRQVCKKNYFMGIVVLGRNPEIYGVGEIVGLFTNVIPVFIHENMTLKSCALHMQDVIFESQNSHYLSIADIMSVGDYMVHDLYCVSNIAGVNGTELLKDHTDQLIMESVTIQEQADYPFYVDFDVQPDVVKVKICYSANRYSFVDNWDIDSILRGIIIKCKQVELSNNHKDLSDSQFDFF